MRWIATFTPVVIAIVGAFFFFARPESHAQQIEGRENISAHQTGKIHLDEMVDGQRVAIWGSVKWEDGRPIRDTDVVGSGKGTWNPVFLGDGKVRIEVSNNFKHPPVVTSTSHGGDVITSVNHETVTTEGFEIRTYDVSKGGWVNDGFTFFAIASVK